MEASLLNYKNLNEAHELAKNGSREFNCWGCTLYILGKAEYLEWVWGVDMEKWLKLNTFKIDEDDLRIGDIIALYEYGLLSHTAVYLGEGKYFHKMGGNEAEVAELDRILEVYFESNEWEYLRLKPLTKP